MVDQRGVGGRHVRSEFIGSVAKETGLRRAVVDAVYRSMVDEIIAVTGRGETLVLSGFGKFYPQPRKGHRVNFGGQVISDYTVLKFSAIRDVNERIHRDRPRNPPASAVGNR